MAKYSYKNNNIKKILIYALAYPIIKKSTITKKYYKKEDKNIKNDKSNNNNTNWVITIY